MNSMRRIRSITPLAILLLTALPGPGCVSQGVDPQKSPKRDLASLRAVFKPMASENAKRHVVCDFLEVDLSRELYTAEVAATYNDAFHQRRWIRAKNASLAGPESTYTFLNHKGRFDNPLKFIIGEAAFTVLGRAIFRLHGKGKARFDLRATGHVSVFAAGKVRQGGEVRVSNGVWQ